MITIVYQKYIKISSRVGYAPPIWKRAKVKGLKESWITIRGTRIKAMSPLRVFGQVPSYSPYCLVSQSAILYIGSVQGCRRTKQKPIVLSMITTSYCRRWWLLTFFENDKTKFAAPLTFLSLKTISPSKTRMRFLINNNNLAIGNF